MLPKLTELFKLISRHDLDVCVWKSEDNFAEGSNGLGGYDIDLYCAPHDELEFYKILTELDFFEVEPGIGKRIPYTSGFLLIDELTGKQCFLHVHYKLITGIDLVKGYILNIDIDFSSDCYVCEKDGVKFLTIELQYILFLIRSSLKCRGYRGFKNKFGISPWLSGKWLEQHEWFSENINCQKSQNLTKIIFNTLDKKWHTNVRSQKFDQLTLNDLYSELIRVLIVRPMYSEFQLRSKFVFRRALQSISFVSRKINFKGLRIEKKRLKGEGVIIAVVGVDGSGKSTLLSEASKALSWKLPIVNAYLGGLGGKYFLSEPIFSLVKFLINFKTKRISSNHIKSHSARKGNDRNLSLRAIWAILLARHKIALLRRLDKAKLNGSVVLTDRWPMLTEDASMDGRIIPKHYAGRSLLCKIAVGMEDVLETLLRRCNPDNIILLEVNPSVAQSRARDMSLDAITARASHLYKIYCDHELVHKVDAEQMPNHVLVSSMSHIKNTILNRKVKYT